jgi:hypothetical protein
MSVSLPRVARRDQFAIDGVEPFALAAGVELRLDVRAARALRPGPRLGRGDDAAQVGRQRLRIALRGEQAALLL